MAREMNISRPDLVSKRDSLNLITPADSTRVYNPSIFYYQMMMSGVPYNGPVPGGKHCTHHNINIVLCPSEAEQSSDADRASLDRILADIRTTADVASTFFAAMDAITENVVVYTSEAERMLKEGNKLFGKTTMYRDRVLDFTKKNSGKLSNRLGLLSIGLKGYDMYDNGVTFSKQVDVLVGMVAFVPGVGWILAGVYSIADAVVKEVTGKDIAENTEGFLTGLIRALEHRVSVWLDPRTYYW